MDFFNVEIHKGLALKNQNDEEIDIVFIEEKLSAMFLNFRWGTHLTSLFITIVNRITGFQLNNYLSSRADCFG